MNIGFIGLGIMGEAMCANIIKKHDGKVFLYDLDGEKVEKLAALGGFACADSAELAEKSDVIITMVPKSEHSRSVYEAVMPALDYTKTCIDMSMRIRQNREFFNVAPQIALAAGARFADAPVVKSRPAAESGTLGIYVGSDEETFEKIRPILAYMGSNIIRMGKNGMGLVMKICHNTLVAQIQNGVNETLALARREGISVDDFALAISYGGGQNFYLDGQAQNIKNENWTTAFSLENMHKDLGICERLSAEANFPMPGMENAKAVYDKGMAAGLGKEDFRATYKVVSGE